MGKMPGLMEIAKEDESGRRRQTVKAKCERPIKKAGSGGTKEDFMNYECESGRTSHTWE